MKDQSFQGEVNMARPSMFAMLLPHAPRDARNRLIIISPRHVIKETASGRLSYGYISTYYDRTPKVLEYDYVYVYVLCCDRHVSSGLS